MLRKQYKDLKKFDSRTEELLRAKITLSLIPKQYHQAWNRGDINWNQFEQHLNWDVLKQKLLNPNMNLYTYSIYLGYFRRYIYSFFSNISYSIKESFTHELINTIIKYQIKLFILYGMDQHVSAYDRDLSIYLRNKHDRRFMLANDNIDNVLQHLFSIIKWIN